MPNLKKDPMEQKTHFIKVRVNEVQYALLQKAAEAAGMNVSEYVRHQAVYGKVDIHNHIVANFDTLKEIARELSSISNNLNQLTKYFNMGGIRSQSMQDELRRCMNEVMEMRKKLKDFEGDYRGYTKTYRK